MNIIKKKYLISIYYFGLFLGVLLMNYILLRHNAFAIDMYENFQSVDKLLYVKEKELFIYLLLKRIKQICLCCVLYFYFSKIITLVVTECYISFIVGMILSIMFYFQGFTGVLISVVMLLPIFILYAALFSLLSYRVHSENSNVIKIVITISFLTIIITMIEMCVYSWLIRAHFGNI